jgi:hypothetical protein
MKPGTSLRIQTVDSDHRAIALGGLIIDVMFFVRGVERYRFDAGETDASGVLVITYEKLEALRREKQKFALMDYNTRLEECDDTIAVNVASAANLAARLEAIEKWYPDDAPRMRQRISGSSNKRVLPTTRRVSAPDGEEHAIELECSGAADERR